MAITFPLPGPFATQWIMTAQSNFRNALTATVHWMIVIDQGEHEITI